MSKYTRGLLAVMLAVVLVLPAAAFAMLPEAKVDFRSQPNTLSK